MHHALGCSLITCSRSWGRRTPRSYRPLNGDHIFLAALEAIRSARKTITHAQYFYEKGAIGLEVAEALSERCRAGVRVHILLDGFGSLLIPADCRDSMTGAGCEVSTFRPLSPLALLAP